MSTEKDIGQLQEHARQTSESLKELREDIKDMRKVFIGFMSAILATLIAHVAISYLTQHAK